MFLAPLLAALLFMVKTISTLVSDSFELTRGQLNYEGKGKKHEKSLGLPQYLLYLWHNVHCKFEQQPIGSALLALPRQYVSYQNCLLFTVILFNASPRFIPEFNVKEHA